MPHILPIGKQKEQLLVLSLKARFVLIWNNLLTPLKEEGELYERTKTLQREKDNLQQLALEEGYTIQDLEHFKTKTQVEEFNLMQKAISRLILNSSGLTVLTKALNSWKEFTTQRKKVKKFAQRVQNYQRKSDLINTFSRWRVWSRKMRQEEEEVSKKELIRM